MTYMLRRQSGHLWIKMAFCLPLALMLALMSSRSTVECISILVLGPSSAAAPASAGSSEAGAVDRKPKPTRQQDRESISCLRHVTAHSQALPIPDAAAVRDGDVLRAASWSGYRNGGVDVVQETLPTYLRPGRIVPWGQRPPPTLPVA